MLNSSISSTPMRSLMKQQRMCLLKTSIGPLRSPGKVCLVQPECRSWVCSARWRKYGIQPMSPSVRENLRSGKRPHRSDHSSSPSVKIVITGESIMRTLGGASFDVCADRDDEPTWQHSTVPSSEHAANSGSQYPEWIDGICSASGFSENVTAWQP